MELRCSLECLGICQTYKLFVSKYFKKQRQMQKLKKVYKTLPESNYLKSKIPLTGDNR